ncbi:hypothetical protein LJC17_03500 [Acholeplasma sp. OttesenSCG-928-E16]|nr:hypothetical protein [Acholeplasma sp. OttesenSCG-928-E16]
MKKRLVISVATAMISVVLTAIGIILSNNEQRVIIGITEVLLLIYISFFLFGGLPRFIIYLFYGIVPLLGVIFFSDYVVAFSVLGTLLFLINPLSSFEKYLNSKFKEGDTLPLRIDIHGSYWPNTAYRKAMKEYFHLPQTRKLYTKKWYLRTRQLLTLVLLAVAIFLLITELGGIVANINELNSFTILSTYGVFILFILAFVLQKKGFTSMFRTIGVTIFPVLIFIIAVSTFSPIFKIIFSVLLSVIALVFIGYEIYLYFQRVAYSSYHYRDVDKNWDVYANALFEPLVYNETFTKVTRYILPISKERFDKKMKDILVYANFHRFIVTTYAFDKKNTIIYADFHYKQSKRITKFQQYLSKQFNVKVDALIIDDVNKKVYETNFFHKTEYIVARALHLASLLKELEIESDIIISMIFYFDSLEDLKIFQEKYFTVRLEELDEEGYYTVRVDVFSPNTDFIIEQKIRDVLMDAMINRGNYVRISVFY